MKKVFSKIFMLSVGALAFTACADEYNPGAVTKEDILKENYAKHWEDVFGTPDPNQDWSMAALTVANVNLPNIPGESKMNIMTGSPYEASTRLLAQVTLKDGKASPFSFDAIKGIDKVFVTVEQNNEYKIYGKYSIDNGYLGIGDVVRPLMTRAFADPADCPTELDELVESSMLYVPSNHGGTAERGSAVIVWNPWGTPVTKTLAGWQEFATERGANLQYNNSDFPIEPTSIMVFEGGSFTGFDWSNWVLKDGASVSYGIYGWDKSGKVNFQYLKKSTVETETAEPWIRGLGQSLVGSSGFFCEQNYYWGPKETTFDKTTLYGTTDEEKLATMKKIESGFKIKATGGIIELPYIYGATGNTDQFGYVLYEDGEDPLAQPHYVLMDDARPESNLYKGVYDAGTSTWSKGTSTHAGTTIYYQWIKGFEDTYLVPANPNMTDYVKDFTEPTWGTTYRLIYFDDEGNASYNIPSTKNIVFFLIKSSDGINHTAKIADNALFYSLPELNERVGNLYGNDNKTTAGGTLTYNADPKQNPIGAVKATSWYDGEHYYLGFEDGGNDEDLNDVVFWVEGAFDVPDPIVKLQPIKWHLNYGGTHDTTDSDLFDIDNKQIGIAYTQPKGIPTNGDKRFLGWSTNPRATSGDMTINGITPNGGVCYFAIWEGAEPGPDPEPISWIFACEDLGGTFDYDFNDVVWEAKKVKDGDDYKLEVKVLAAGGTLPFTLKYNGTLICTKTTAFNETVENSDVINANAGKTATPKIFTIGITEDWTISSNYTKFTVEVENHGATSHISAYSKEETAESKAPQVILLPSEWEWPTEGTNISAAYTNFTTWVTDGAAAPWSEWLSHKTGNTVSRQ